MNINIAFDDANRNNELLRVEQLNQKAFASTCGSPHSYGKQYYGKSSGLFNCYDIAADVRGDDDT